MKEEDNGKGNTKESATERLLSFFARPPGRKLNVALWVFQVAIALMLGFIGARKLMGTEMELERFARIGIGQWLRYVTGLIEVSGSIALVVPRTSVIGAIVIAAVMFGAFVTQQLRLDGSFFPLVVSVVALYIAWARRGDVQRLLSR